MIRITRIFTILLFACLIAALDSAAARAQTVPSSPAPSPPADPCGTILSTVNRPTLSTSPCSVRSNHVLVESGYTNTTTGGGSGGTTVAYPQALVRIGTSDPHLEFDLTPPSHNRSSFGQSTVTGSSDIAIGAQTELGYNSKAVWGANAFVTIPTGSPAFTAGSAQYVGNFNWNYTLSSALSLFGTLGFDGLSSTNAAGGPQPYFAFIPSAGVTLALPASSQIFAEYAYFSHTGTGSPGKSLLDFGYQHTTGPHVLLDVNYGFSLTTVNGQSQHYVGAGLSFMN
jgi:hypothetical protein